MKKFIVQLFSNRFGIILAALNVCYLVSCGEVFAHNALGKFFLSINVPSICATVLSLEFLTLFTGRKSPFTEYVMGNALFVFYIVLQWLFIAWFSYALAAKIRQTAWWKNHEIRW
jgi:hypothetical protein